MEQFELIAYHQRCAVLQARGWRRRRRGARRVEERLWGGWDWRGELVLPVKGDYNGKLPETSATAAAKSRRFARGVGALSTYQTRASTGLHVILRSCFRRYTPAIYEVGRSVRVCYCTVRCRGKRLNSRFWQT